MGEELEVGARRGFAVSRTAVQLAGASEGGKHDEKADAVVVGVEAFMKREKKRSKKKKKTAAWTTDTGRAVHGAVTTWARDRQGGSGSSKEEESLDVCSLSLSLSISLSFFLSWPASNGAKDEGRGCRAWTRGRGVLLQVNERGGTARGETVGKRGPVMGFRGLKKKKGCMGML